MKLSILLAGLFGVFVINVVASDASRSLANSTGAASLRSSMTEGGKALKVSNSELERQLQEVDEEDEVEFDCSYPTESIVVGPQISALKDNVAQWMGMLERSNLDNRIFSHVLALVSNQFIAELCSNRKDAEAIRDNLRLVANSNSSNTKREYLDARLKLFEKIIDGSNSESVDCNIEADQEAIKEHLVKVLQVKNSNQELHIYHSAKGRPYIIRDGKIYWLS